jgi:hypothetical protein
MTKSTIAKDAKGTNQFLGTDSVNIKIRRIKTTIKEP